MFVKQPEETSNNGVAWDQARGMKASGRLINSTLCQPHSTCCRSFEASIRKKKRKKGAATTIKREREKGPSFRTTKEGSGPEGEGGVTFGVDVIRTFLESAPKSFDCPRRPHISLAPLPCFLAPTSQVGPIPCVALMPRSVLPSPRAVPWRSSSVDVRIA